MCWNGKFCTSRIPKIDLTWNLSDRKIMKFLHCGSPSILLQIAAAFVFPIHLRFAKFNHFNLFFFFCIQYLKSKPSNSKDSMENYKHSEKIWGFFCNSDFTWNQFWIFWKCKISHLTTFRSTEFLILWIFALFEGWNLPK